MHTLDNRHVVNVRNHVITLSINVSFKCECYNCFILVLHFLLRIVNESNECMTICKLLKFLLCYRESLSYHFPLFQILFHIYIWNRLICEFICVSHKLSFTCLYNFISECNKFLLPLLLQFDYGSSSGRLIVDFECNLDSIFKASNIANNWILL